MKKVIIDCDPGYDDALALLLAVASEDVQVLGVMATAGNTGIEKTYPNVKKILKFLSVDIPVGKGASEPLFRSFKDGADVHGETGIDGVNLPQLDEQPEVSTMDLMRRLLDGSSEPVTLITLGPLTNVALFLKAFPSYKEKINEIVMMGGSATVGNVTPVAEYNVYADAEAAKIVVDSGLPIVMVGLNITNDYQLLPETFGDYRQLGGVGVMVAEVLENYNKFYQTLGGKFLGPAIHDYCAVAYVTNPELFEVTMMTVDVECNGAATYGQTVCHQRGDNKVKVLTESDHEGLTDLLVDTINKLNK